jgi:hypothetical protein
MTFRLYDDDGDAVGEAVWSETQSVPVNDGLFNVDLGATEPITTALFVQKLWLGVEVEGDGEMTPRQELTGAPYAMSLVAGAGIQGAVSKDEPLPGSLNVYNSGDGYGLAVQVQGEAGIAMDGSFADIPAAQNGLLIDNFLHGAVITSADGSGVQIFADGGVINDNYGLQAHSQIGDGVFGWSFGEREADVGVSGRGENGYGVYGFSYGTSEWGLYTPDNLYVGGSCTGCALRYVGYNASDVTLQPGDMVSAVGVTNLKGMSTPVIKVAPTTTKSVLGVVAGYVEMYMVEAGVNDAQPGAHFGAVGGKAAPGDYLIIVVQGPAQVRAAEAGIEAGDLVYQAAEGVSARSVGPAIGMALDSVDSEGLVWVLVGFH